MKRLIQLRTVDRKDAKESEKLLFHSRSFCPTQTQTVKKKKHNGTVEGCESVQHNSEYHRERVIKNNENLQHNKDENNKTKRTFMICSRYDEIYI